MFQSVTTVHDIIIPKGSGFGELKLSKERLTGLDTIIQKVAKADPKGNWQYGAKKAAFASVNYTAWSTTRAAAGFVNMNHACHASLGGIHPPEQGNFLLNIIRHEVWVKRLAEYDPELFEMAKAYYDWISSPDGPFGLGMKDVTVIRDVESGLILAQLWLDLKDVPFVPVVSSCLNSRLFTEHQYLIPSMQYLYNFEGRKDIAFAFLGAPHFNAKGLPSYSYVSHSGYDPKQFHMSKHFIDYSLNNYPDAGCRWSIYVNKKYKDREVQFKDFEDFVKKYDKERKKVK